MAEQQEPNKKGNPVVKLVNNRNFLVFIAFVVLSSFLWFLNYLNKNLTSEITIKYKLKNVPKTINEESSHGGELFVMASGQGYNLLQESLKTRNLPLSIDLESKAQDNRQLLKYASSRGKAYIISSDLKPLLRKKVGEKINIGEIKPDTLFFNLIDVREKKVPIETANIEHKLLDGQKITRTSIVPDSVTIIGQKSIIDSIDKIGVEKEDLGLIKARKQYNVAIEMPEGVSVSQKIASVSYDIEMYTKATKRIKVKAVNFPTEYTYTLLPEYVTVNYVVPISLYGKVNEYDFSATIDYEKAAGNCAEVQVQSSFSKAEIISSQPSTCTFILEKK
ncbi:MAG: hypothetical protein II037_12855 [Bacteroidales bacterium]|nr:hypothetical protein [Bacteroidales bacterium]